MQTVLNIFEKLVHIKRWTIFVTREKSADETEQQSWFTWKWRVWRLLGWIPIRQRFDPSSTDELWEKWRNGQVSSLMCSERSRERKGLCRVHLRISSTKEWTASSFKDGISNNAGWKRSSRAVGRLAGSVSKHLKTRSWTTVDTQSKREKNGAIYFLHRIIEGFNCFIHNFVRYCMRITVTTEIEIDHLEESAWRATDRSFVVRLLPPMSLYPTNRYR